VSFPAVTSVAAAKRRETAVAFTNTARTFDGTDAIVFPTTGGPTAHPMAFMFIARHTVDIEHQLGGLSADAVNTFGRWVRVPLISAGNITWYDQAVGGQHGGTSMSLNDWWTIIAGKDASTGTAYMRMHNHATETWTHATTTSLTGGGDLSAGRFVAGHARPNTSGSTVLPWVGQLAMMATFDSVSQAEAEAMIAPSGVVARSLVEDANPTHIWSFDQTNVATAVNDLVGSANQESITGTAVYTAAGTVPWNVAA
jgi:hypothetical protein